MKKEIQNITYQIVFFLKVSAWAYLVMLLLSFAVIGIGASVGEIDKVTKELLLNFNAVLAIPIALCIAMPRFFEGLDVGIATLLSFATAWSINHFIVFDGFKSEMNYICIAFIVGAVIYSLLYILEIFLTVVFGIDDIEVVVGNPKKGEIEFVQIETKIENNDLKIERIIKTVANEEDLNPELRERMKEVAENYKATLEENDNDKNRK